MAETVLVYKGKEIAAYGFGDPHPFGTDRHDVFHAELDKAGLSSAVEFGHARPEKFQECADKFDVVLTCEEKIYDSVVASFEERQSEHEQPVHVVNMDVVSLPLQSAS